MVEAPNKNSWTAHTEADLRVVAQNLLSQLSPTASAHVLALQGDLGAGKTTLTQALARELNIKENVTSPTFVIMRSYPILGHPFLTTLTHIDAYRIEDDAEMRVLGFEELLRDPHRLVVIEWPERIAELIPQGSQTVVITIQEGTTRTITYDE